MELVYSAKLLKDEEKLNVYSFGTHNEHYLYLLSDKDNNPKSIRLLNSQTYSAVQQQITNMLFYSSQPEKIEENKNESEE